MSKKNVMAKGMNNSNTLPSVDVLDATTTKGKTSAKFNLNDSTEAEAETEKIDKNQLFLEISDFFCPVKFDSSLLESNLQPLVKSGIMSEDAMNKAIARAKAEFLKAHEEEINAANKLSFAEVCEKLQSNQTLYKKVLQVCKVGELSESNYIIDGKVAIYRSNQCLDSEGNPRYKDVTLTASENGINFSANLFVEYREITTNNILLSIRYFNAKLDAQKSILNKLSDYRRILSNVAENVQKAKDNKFSKEQVINIVNEIYG